MRTFIATESYTQSKHRRDCGVNTDYIIGQRRTSWGNVMHVVVFVLRVARFHCNPVRGAGIMTNRYPRMHPTEEDSRVRNS
jgi:hypothetical protein